MDQTAGAKKRGRSNSKKPAKKASSSSKKPAKKASSSSKKPAKKAGKKKLTGFMKFLSEKREQLKKSYPGAAVQEIAKKAGALWRALTDSEKKRYK